MQTADLDRVAAAAREFHAASPLLRENGGGFRLDHFREIWTQLLDGGGGVIFADFDESGASHGAITGLLGGVIHRGIYGDQLIAEEFFWFVRESHRGGGVRLYRRFEQWARERGAASIQMVHLFDSMPEKVARFYLRAGFKPIEMRYAKALTNGTAA
ncbi:MAG TPA: GNAT family N-acetyltransferase [Paraburkholderia sp.]|jgi:GNAT superfamily N-acetyltransferase